MGKGGNPYKKRKLTELEEQGLVHAFEFTPEFAWNRLRDFLENRGTKDMYGQKDTAGKAFKLDLIEDGDICMDMVLSRTKTSHTYNQEVVEEIVNQKKYFEPFLLLREKLQKLKKAEPGKNMLYGLKIKTSKTLKAHDTVKKGSILPLWRKPH
ncbi:MAG: nucleotidyltransferase substrate binding protein [Nitrospinota bacterium]